MSSKVYFVDDAGTPPVALAGDAAGPPKEVCNRLEKRPILIDLTEGLAGRREAGAPRRLPEVPGRGVAGDRKKQQGRHPLIA